MKKQFFYATLILMSGMMLFHGCNKQERDATMIASVAYASNDTLIMKCNLLGVSVSDFNSFGFVLSANGKQTVYECKESGEQNQFTYTLIKSMANVATVFYAYGYSSDRRLVSDEASVTMEASKPQVNTLRATATESMGTAEVVGELISDGGSSVTSLGICYSENQDPTIIDTYVTSQTTSVGPFKCYLYELTPRKTYYVRAFAKNAKGLVYGTQLSVVAAGLGKVTMSQPSVNNGYVNCIGDLKDIGYDDEEAKAEVGFVYSTKTSPTINNTKVVCTTKYSTGSFQKDFQIAYSGTYYVRAYVTNKYGTSYSDEYSITVK